MAAGLENIGKTCFKYIQEFSIGDSGMVLESQHKRCNTPSTRSQFVDDDRMLQVHTHSSLMALCPGLPGWAGTRKVKPIWILLKQETVSGSGISWAICKSAHRSRQLTTPAPHHSVFYRPDALPAAQPTASKHWRHRMLPGKNDKSHRTSQTIIP